METIEELGMGDTGESCALTEILPLIFHDGPVVQRLQRPQPQQQRAAIVRQQQRAVVPRIVGRGQRRALQQQHLR